MVSRQEKRAAARAEAKLAKRTTDPQLAPLRAEWDCDQNQERLEVSPDVIRLRAPPCVPGKSGRDLRVLRAFITDAGCPHGAGLVCYQLEEGVRALRLKNGRLHWMVAS